MKTKLVLVFILAGHLLNGQTKWKEAFPHRGLSLQFAGSVGFLSAGIFRRTPREKIELSAIYGYTPEFFGGPVHSASLKFNYTPFHIGGGRYFSIEPLQCGVFVAQNFGKNLYVLWPVKYPRGYYWWPNGLRQHVFLGVQASFLPKNGGFKKISLYFEANTNDLYLYSFLPSKGDIGLYDIVFFGAGTKATFR